MEQVDLIVDFKTDAEIEHHQHAYECFGISSFPCRGHFE